MSQLLRRKPISELIPEGAHSLKRVLTAGDLIMLAIGAVIGAGIFGAIGTAAAGQVTATGVVVRYGAGPALVFSFLLLGGACALAALCYAELAAMIPQAGSAYAYSYATMREIVAWIIGWDLILEYAVGNVAVAISWGDYFKRVLSAVNIHLPEFLTTGYRTALLADPAKSPELHALLDSAPRILGIPILVNIPAFAIVAFITWLLLLGVKESTRANTIMVIVKLVVLAMFIIVGSTRIDTANYHPFAPNGFTGIHHGAAIVFFAYIGFDAISTAAEETKNPQRNLPIGILAGLGICTLIYVIVGAVLTGMVPYTQLGVADPLARALDLAGLTKISTILSLGAIFSMAAVLLVFQYGQPRIFFAMARDGLLPRWAAKIHPKYRTPYTTTLLTGGLVALASLVGDASETYDLTNIGTLFAFVLVCVGVLVLRVKEPERPRPFRVPFVWVVAPLGALACAFVMKGLPKHAWERFGIWLVIGIALYFAYGYRNSTLRRGAPPVPVTPPPPIEKN
jgi:APA family basic amino acid/polyamine antiporter